MAIRGKQGEVWHLLLRRHSNLTRRLRDELGRKFDDGRCAAEVAMRAGHADVAMLLITAERDAVDEMQLRLERLEAEAHGNSREAARLVALLDQGTSKRPASTQQLA